MYHQNTTFFTNIEINRINRNARLSAGNIHALPKNNSSIKYSHSASLLQVPTISSIENNNNNTTNSNPCINNGENINTNIEKSDGKPAKNSMGNGSVLFAISDDNVIDARCIDSGNKIITRAQINSK